MSLKLDAFPASEAFEKIQEVLASSEVERKKAIKDANAVFAFKLKNKAGVEEKWHIDLKKSGVVGRGLGDNPTVTLSISDENFGKLVLGEANAQRLFMSGKLKISGDVLKANAMQTILKKAHAASKAKL